LNFIRFAFHPYSCFEVVVVVVVVVEVVPAVAVDAAAGSVLDDYAVVFGLDFELVFYECYLAILPVALIYDYLAVSGTDYC